MRTMTSESYLSKRSPPSRQTLWWPCPRSGFRQQGPMSPSCLRTEKSPPKVSGSQLVGQPSEIALRVSPARIIQGGLCQRPRQQAGQEGPRESVIFGFCGFGF